MYVSPLPEGIEMFTLNVYIKNSRKNIHPLVETTKILSDLE